MRIERFFDEQAKSRVAEAVKVAEARTSGQIVPVVVERSHDRGSHVFASLGSAYLAVLMMLGLRLAIPSIYNGPEQAFVFAVTFGLVNVLLNALPAYRRLAYRQQLEAAVWRRALLAFVQHGVHRTREENGVLLFASIEERRVVVLGDRAVHLKLGTTHWQRAVDSLVEGIRAGDPASGFCTAIAAIGDEMAVVFPRQGDAPANELSDELRVDR